MTLQNRVDPWGNLQRHPSKSATLMGNRGILHDEDKKILKLWGHSNWVSCVTNYKNIKRAVFSANNYSELFFLDEGFGTLDDELLEVVMSSLERIHNEKLKVGIIRHVEAIKNRVPVKLIITPAECGIGGSKVKIERS